MKNTIPLVIAVILAAAAVYLVAKLIHPKEEDDKQTVEVVCATRAIPVDTVIDNSMLTTRTIDARAQPAKAVAKNQSNFLIGKMTTRAVAEGDYVVMDDVSGVVRDLTDRVNNGEWAVPVTFADASLVQFLKPGVEIAILGSFSLKRTSAKVDSTEKPEERKEEATSVIFPCVRILDIGHGDGLRRDENGRQNGTVVVALTPQQAATLIAAQRTMELYPALRHRSDGGTMKRRDVGMVTDKTFEGLRQGLETVTIPDSDKK